MKLLAKGAEADVYEGSLVGMPAVFKIRKPKAYRVKVLDISIRTSRTRKEAKLLGAAKGAAVRCPLVLLVGTHEIVMSRIGGRLMMRMGKEKQRAISPSVGSLLAALHSAGICHGDFTPANVIVEKGVAWVIDFGLGDFTREDEELATDVLLMKKSLHKQAYARFLRAYSKDRGRGAGATLKRLKEIEKRGRYVVRGALA
ncbi:MAG: Kae1-associated serine/threonine protein kinase [Candidatus Aenigmarchaeota archaeon]|nr:Kae1-associated serine/threonine protein kinase [Candidatus Aenigmarchaeota archaeon]